MPRSKLRTLAGVWWTASSLLCAACSYQPPEWSSLVATRIRSQYPNAQIDVQSSHAMQALLDSYTVTVDTDEIALQCNRGPRDCDRAVDQVLLVLCGIKPGPDAK